MAEIIAPSPRPGVNFHFENVNSFYDIGRQVVEQLGQIQKNGKEIVFVAGPIGSTGRTREEDMEHLFDLTRQREELGFIAFSSGNFFPKWGEWKKRLPEFKFKEKERGDAFDELSRQILSSKLCDRIFMARDSDKSRGAKIEKAIAEDLGMTVQEEEVKNDLL